MPVKYHAIFAQAYGEGSYGECDYSSTDVACVSGSSSGKSGLADTGVAAIAFITLACLIIFVSLLVRVWRRPSSKSSPKKSESRRKA